MPHWATAVDVTANARLLYSPGVSGVRGSVLPAAQGRGTADAGRCARPAMKAGVVCRVG